MTTPKIPHGFCINLDRRPDRLKAFHERLPPSLRGIIERFRAVDGSDLTMDARLAELFENNDFHYRRNIIGCSLSHLSLWHMIADEDYPYERTLVFEDDVWFSRRFDELWDGGMVAQLPGDFDIVYIGGLLGPPMIEEMVALMEEHEGHIEVPRDIYVATQENPWFARPKTTQFCTYSYILSREGARKLCALAERDRFERSIDWFMIDRWPEMNVYASTPLLCWAVFQEGSDILLNFETLRSTAEAENAHS